IPQDNAPGVTYGAEYQDTLDVAHVEGQSDGDVFPLVIDPSALTGLVYTITFDTIPGGEVVWNADRSDGVRVLENQTNQSADAESPIADGIQFRVIGAPETFKDFAVVSNASGVLDPTEPGAVDFQGFPTIPSPIDDDPNPTERQQVGEGHWAFHTWDDGGTNDGGTRGSFDAWIARTTRNGFDNIIPNDFEMRFTGTVEGEPGGGYSARVFDDGGTTWVPFELWNIGSNTPDDLSDDFRMVPWHFDTDANGIYDMSNWGDSNTPGNGAFEHSASGSNNDPYTDPIYWAQPEDVSPGSAGYDAAEAEMLAGTYTGDRETEVLARTVLMNWNGGEQAPFTQDMPETGTIFRLTSTKPNGVGVDVFTFTAPAETQSNDLARSQVGDINVFPNPYYGINSEEINKYNRFVTFTHLPERAKIRIFNLAGVLVRTIEKDDVDQYQRWDLSNDSGLPVASGLYLAYIELTDLGETTILKVAIIQEQQILDRF
ncbi:MAG: T9SS type A sorting domain-containing protein, partial [Cyclobacteriaceae bacterium]|nr:T9SS type A sorting domain-containing protein [Cyclobacteriaceae bacterium]